MTYIEFYVINLETKITKFKGTATGPNEAMDCIKQWFLANELDIVDAFKDDMLWWNGFVITCVDRNVTSLETRYSHYAIRITNWYR